MKLSGSQLRIRSRSSKTTQEETARSSIIPFHVALCFRLFTFLFPFFFLHARTRTLVAGEYYYSRLNSSSDSQVNAKVGARI